MADDSKMKQWQRQGWSPSKWRHLHADLKALIRDTGYRPSIKACFHNSQLLFLAAEGTPLENRLSYHEGWSNCVGLPIEHAWLALDGVIQDPTLDRPAEYLCSLTYTRERVRENIQNTGLWCPVDGGALWKLMYGAQLEELLAQIPKG